MGPDGDVVVTDISLRWLDAERWNIEVHRHAIIGDPLEHELFDLDRERLVRICLSEGERAVRRLVDALKPGGWLSVEDSALECLTFILRAGLPEAGTSCGNAAFRESLERAGAEAILGPRLQTWQSPIPTGNDSPPLVAVLT